MIQSPRTNDTRQIRTSKWQLRNARARQTEAQFHLSFLGSVMSTHSIACSQCSATLRYSASQAGRMIKCPRCKSELVLPANRSPEVEEEKPVGLHQNEAANVCVRCGKKVKPGVSKCKKCREVVNAQLEARMKQDSTFEGAQVSQAKYLAMRHSHNRPFPHALHILLAVVTCGVWTPFYLRTYRGWQTGDDE
jgi:DNA-directed RNA polymerase subunit RPC12/RpoP